MLQPDIFVVCDETELDGQNCNGAPDFIIEIVSPSTGTKDEITKADLYERNGVRKYSTIHPSERLLFVRLLGVIRLADSANKFAIAGLAKVGIDNPFLKIR